MPMETAKMKRFSYVSKQRESPYQYDTIINCFMRNAEKHPDKEILIRRDIDGSRETITNEALKSKALQLSRYLISIGIKKGDHVALFGPNTMEWVIGEVAVINTGGISVHIAFSTTDASDILDISNQVKCKAFLIDPGKDERFHNTILQLTKNLEENKAASTASPTIIFLRDMQGMESYPVLGKILEMEIDGGNFPTLYPEDTIAVFTTSGSTGKPKMVPYDHFKFVSVQMSTITEDGNATNMVFYNDRPFGWLGGSPLMFLCEGRTRVFTDAPSSIPGKDALAIWNIIKAEKCTHAMLMPYVLNDLICMKDKYEDPFKLQLIFTGGQIVDDCYMQVVGVFTESLGVAYGSTESCAISVLSPLKIGDTLKVGHVGKIFPGVEIKIIDQNSNVTTVGVPGEICVRSSLVFPGYYMNEEETRKCFIPGRWLKTGDIGYITEDESLVVEGRTKDVVSRGTRKIMPGAVEDVILKMDNIQHVIVVAVPDKRLYEEVCACFVAKEGCDVSEEDVENYCNRKMLREQSIDGLGDIPTYFLKFDDFPCLSTGKPDKPKIQQTARERLGLWL